MDLRSVHPKFYLDESMTKILPWSNLTYSNKCIFLQNKVQNNGNHCGFQKQTQANKDQVEMRFCCILLEVAWLSQEIVSMSLSPHSMILVRWIEELGRKISPAQRFFTQESSIGMVRERRKSSQTFRIYSFLKSHGIWHIGLDFGSRGYSNAIFVQFP